MERLLRANEASGQATVLLQFCEASQFDGVTPPVRHVARVGHSLTCCGRRVTVLFELHPTDTVSDVECDMCRAWLDRHTI